MTFVAGARLIRVDEPPTMYSVLLESRGGVSLAVVGAGQS